MTNDVHQRNETSITTPSDTEIRIGNIMPYSGPASAYGTIGKTLAAYFNKVNAEGGKRRAIAAIGCKSVKRRAWRG